MSAFEVITIVLSLILGLSAGHILWSVASVVRARERLRMHWLPFAWAAAIFFQHASFFLGSLMIDRRIAAWAWSWYAHVLLLAVLLFASGALVLPSESEERVGNLLDDFRKHGRLALIPFAAYHLAWIVMNARLNGIQFDDGQLANVLLLTVMGVGFWARSLRVQGLAALGFLALLTWANVFVWSQIVL
ncbi:MAG: hypothetical protein HKO77_01065 [Gemmatimonadetes bacterium]|nr:hypothetical protein [Gemmatimonadota bacterium]NNL29575.1 hypothetical protein [Gemmatimonadota bacterium]